MAGKPGMSISSHQFTTMVVECPVVPRLHSKVEEPSDRNLAIAIFQHLFNKLYQTVLVMRLRDCVSLKWALTSILRLLFNFGAAFVRRSN